MLPGIEVKPIKRLADERGFFHEVMRQDFEDEVVMQCVRNVSRNCEGMAQARERAGRLFCLSEGSDKDLRLRR